MIRLFQKFGWVLALIVVLLFALTIINLVLDKSRETNNTDLELSKVPKQEEVDLPEEDPSEDLDPPEEVDPPEEALIKSENSNVLEQRNSEKASDKIENAQGTVNNSASKLLDTSKDQEIFINNSPENFVTKEETEESGPVVITEKDLERTNVDTLTDLQINSDAETADPYKEKSSTEQLSSGDTNDELENKLVLDQDSNKVEQKKQSVSVEVDILRVDNTGQALVAGSTQPNSKVEVLADDKVVGSAESDSDGEFVVMGTIDPSSESQTVTVRSGEKNGAQAEKSKIETVNQNDSKEINRTSDEKLNWTLAEEIFVILPLSIRNDSFSKIGMPKAPIIVQSSSNDIKIVQNSDIAPVKEIIIDSISYSDLGEAVLVGRANPDNRILVYLDNVLKTSSDVGASGGWSTELTGLEPGVYELRLDEVDTSGSVKSRIMTPFKKESKDFLMNMVSGSITVQTGNSLWRIARRIFGRGIRYIEIYEKNNDLIKDPDLIYPGQVFSIPTNN